MVIDLNLILLILFFILVGCVVIKIKEGSDKSGYRRNVRRLSFDNYISTNAVITNIEEQTIKIHQQKNNSYTDLGQPSKPVYDSNLTALNSMIARRQIKKVSYEDQLSRSMSELNSLMSESAKEVVRYNVTYEYEDSSGNSYSAQSIIYKLPPGYDKGEYIEIKYKPTNPNASFIAAFPPI